MKRLLATEFSLLLLLPPRPLSIVADTRPEVEVEELEEGELSAKRARLSSTTKPVALVSQSISTFDRLSNRRDFVRRVRVEVEFLKTEEKIRVYLRAKLVNVYRG